jgi:hypothetical protein
LAVAAAAAVLIGGTAIYRQASTPQQSGAAVASDNFSAQASEAAPIVPGSAISDSTATANTRVIDGSAVAASKDTIATAIGAALANLNQSASGAAAQGTGTAQGTGAAVVPAPISQSSEAAIVSSTAGSPWADCLVKVDGGSAGGLTAVVTGITYQGRTADVLVRTVDANHLDIWVIAIGCTGAKTDLLDHEVVVV